MTSPMPLSLPGILFSIFSAYLKSYFSFKAQLLSYLYKSFYVSNYNKLLEMASYFNIKVYKFMNTSSKYFTMILC